LKILITGGNGFIGSHVVDEALKRGMDVTIFDRHMPKQSIDCAYFLGDIRDAEAIQEAVSKVDYAINLAGLLGTQETINNPLPCIATNLTGCVNFLQACVPTKFHEVRAAQIGVGNYWMNNSYSITKNAAIRFCKMYNKEHGAQVAMVRGLNAYGPRQKHKPIRKILPTFIKQALFDKDIEVYGDGSQTMDMIYVGDLAKILLDVCISSNVDYDKVYEGGTGRALTVNHIAHLVIEAIGSRSRVNHLTMRPGEPERSEVVGDPNTLTGLGDYDLLSFEEGLARTVPWYQHMKECDWYDEN